MTVPSDTPDDDQNHSVGSSIAGETTRVEAVRYLEGASGHGVFSLALLLLACIFLYENMFGTAVLAGLIAYGVALNGLSIYLWDKLRLYFGTRFRNADSEATRTLRVHQISPEMKAELASGAVIVGGFSIFLGVVLGLVRTVGFQQTAVLAGAGLALGNLVALGWSYSRS